LWFGHDMGSKIGRKGWSPSLGFKKLLPLRFKLRWRTCPMR
jgi:hypothetical protein